MCYISFNLRTKINIYFLERKGGNNMKKHIHVLIISTILSIAMVISPLVGTSAAAANDTNRTKPIGMQNLYNSCYFNALIQQLYNIENFRNAILEYKIGTPDRELLAYRLKKIFSLINENQLGNKENVSFECELFCLFRYQNICLIDKDGMAITKSPIDVFNTLMETLKKESPNLHSRLLKIIGINFDKNNPENLIPLVKLDDVLDKDNQITKIQNSPEILMLQSPSLNNDEISASTIDKYADNIYNTTNSTGYTISGIIVQASASHYVSYIKDPATQVWYLADDTSVEEVSLHEIVSEVKNPDRWLQSNPIMFIYNRINQTENNQNPETNPDNDTTPTKTPNKEIQPPTPEDRQTAIQPTGLINGRNTCYFNSIVQQLYNIEPIRNAILKYEIHNPETEIFAQSLKRMFSLIQSKQNTPNARVFLGDELWDLYLKNNKENKNKYKQIFQSEDDEKDQNMENPKENKSKMAMTKDSSQVINSMLDIINVESIELYNCILEICGAKVVPDEGTAQESVVPLIYLDDALDNDSNLTQVKNSPDVLMIQSPSLTYTPKDPKTIIDKYTKEIHNPIGNTSYTLNGIIVHVGTGHYVSYVKNSTTNQWYLADDDSVQPTTLDTIIDEIRNPKRWGEANPVVFIYSKQASSETITPGTDPNSSKHNSSTITTENTENQNSKTPAPKQEPFTIDRTDITLGVNESNKLIAKLGNTPATENLEWKSSNNDIATVSPDGTVLATKVGETTITATNSDKRTARCNIKVIKGPSEVTLSTNNLIIGANDEFIIEATTDCDLNGLNFNWDSSNPTVATIEKVSVNKAKITAQSVGTSVISIVMYNCLTASCEVSVKEPPKEISLNTGDRCLRAGEKFTIEEHTNSNSYALNFTWSSSNPKVATIEKGSANNAIVTARGAGTTIIEARTYNNISKHITVTVKPVGLNNGHNICFFNAIIQQMYNIEGIRNAILGYKINNKDTEHLAQALKNMFSKISNANSPAVFLGYDLLELCAENPDKYKDICLFENGDSAKFHDSFQSFINIMSTLNEESYPLYLSIMETIGIGTMNGCQHLVEPFIYITNRNITQDSEIVDANIIKSPRETLILQNTELVNTQINGNPVPANTIDTLTRDIFINTHDTFSFYCLTGIVVNTGGHYISYIRNSDSQKWYVTNDSYVEETSLQTIVNKIKNSNSGQKHITTMFIYQTDNKN